MSINRTALFEQCRQVLGTTQAELGEMLGVSRRTAQRWSTHGLPSYEMANVARLVHPRDPQLAREIVEALGTTLEGAGIVQPAPPPAAPAVAPPSPDGVVDAVVCAAADAMEMVPKDVRPGLHAAFVRAREIGLTVEIIERALRSTLRAAEPATPTPADTPPPKRKSVRQ